MRRLLMVGLAATVAACSADPPADDRSSADEADAPAPAVAPVAEGDPEPPAAVVPPPLRGRWGLTANDCTSTRGDAKGRLDVSDRELRFYESRAVLRDVEASDDASLEAIFDFTGEGQTWQRRMSLEITDDGRTLVRRESGPDAMPGPLRYLRCGA